jgi:hypothetical protein
VTWLEANVPQRCTGELLLPEAANRPPFHAVGALIQDRLQSLWVERLQLPVLEMLPSTLRQLRLYLPKLSSEEWAALNRLTELRSLRIALGATDVFHRAVIQAVGRLPRLQTLQLRLVRFYNARLEHVGCLSEVDLGACTVNEAAICAIAAAPELTTLKLSDCDGVTHAALVAIAGSRSLRKLHLRHVATMMPLAELGTMNELEELDLAGSLVQVRARGWIVLAQPLDWSWRQGYQMEFLGKLTSLLTLSLDGVTVSTDASAAPRRTSPGAQPERT